MDWRKRNQFMYAGSFSNVILNVYLDYELGVKYGHNNIFYVRCDNSVISHLLHQYKKTGQRV